MTHAQWKAYYRLLRICRRECAKASLDMILYGTGAVKVGPDVPDLVQYVPISELKVA